MRERHVSVWDLLCRLQEYRSEGCVLDPNFLFLQPVYFYPDMDIAILKEVASLKPYRFPEKWPEVAANANAVIRVTRPSTKEISVHSLQDHLDVLLKHDKKENVKELTK